MKRIEVLFIVFLSVSGMILANKMMDSSYIRGFRDVEMNINEVDLGDKVCNCGGKLRWTAKCYTEKVRCNCCHGKGYLRSGNYKTDCSMCDGKGYYHVWKSGYVCTRCGKRYSD